MQRNAPIGYTKILVRGIPRAEMVLEVVMSPHKRARDYVEQYMVIGQQLPVSDAVELQVLDMKKARRTEQNQLLEILRHSAAQRGRVAPSVPFCPGRRSGRHSPARQTDIRECSAVVTFRGRGDVFFSHFVVYL